MLLLHVIKISFVHVTLHSIHVSVPGHQCCHVAGHDTFVYPVIALAQVLQGQLAVVQAVSTSRESTSINLQKAHRFKSVPNVVIEVSNTFTLLQVRAGLGLPMAPQGRVTLSPTDR